jgi:hypothetical protein
MASGTEKRHNFLNESMQEQTTKVPAHFQPLSNYKLISQKFGKGKE